MSLVLASPYKRTTVTEDIDFDKVAVLLHMNGGDGSTSFFDECGHTVQRIGNAVQSATQSRFGSSALYCPTGSDYALITPSPYLVCPGNFTNEFWFYCASLPANYAELLGCLTANAADQWTIEIGSTGRLTYYYSGFSTPITGSHTLTAGAWHHIAAVRVGTTITLYADGVVDGTTTYSGSAGSATAPIYIGGRGNSPGSSTVYIDEVRITRAARYTAPFTPPSAQFLGGVSTVDPYYSFVTMLLNMEGANNGTTFTDAKGHTMTRLGNVVTSTAQKKWGTSSAYYDGVATNGIRTPATSDFSFGTGDFTVEGYAYYSTLPATNTAWPTDYPNWGVVWETGTFNGADGQQLRCNNTQIAFGINDTTLITGNHGMSASGWYHLAVTRTGTVLRLFVNGVLVATATGITGAIPSTLGANVYIGCETEQGAYHKGYLDEIRVTKGISRYVSTFTPYGAAFPTA